MSGLDSLLVQLRDEDPARFNTGEYIERGVIFPSLEAYAAIAFRRKGFGYTYTNGQPVPRYYQRIGGGWVRLYGPPVIHKGRKPR